MRWECVIVVENAHRLWRITHMLRTKCGDKFLLFVKEEVAEAIRDGSSSTQPIVEQPAE